jgi:DNA repair exonuclease SbcCD ATPase subunit
MHRQLKSCLSFANIKNNKAKPEQLHTPRTTTINATTVLTTRKHKENRYNVPQPVEPPNSNLMIQAYKMQNESLKDTVALLKDQVEILQSSSATLKEQLKQAREDAAAKNDMLGQARKEAQECRVKEREYVGITQKIEELEELQDEMILQNKQLREREAIFKALMGNVLVATGANSDATSVYIKSLINKTLGQM